MPELGGASRRIEAALLREREEEKAFKEARGWDPAFRTERLQKAFRPGR